MPHFPAISSALSPLHLVRLLVDRYGIDSKSTCEVIRLGVNHTYLIKGPTTYVLRVYTVNWKTEVEISEELRLLTLLHKSDISVSYPIEDLEGTIIQQIEAPEGRRYAVLFSFANGLAIWNPTIKTSNDLGQLTAKMHQVTAQLDLDRVYYDIDTLVQKPYQLIKERFTTHLSEVKYFKRAINVIRQEFAIAEKVPLRKGVVHLDIFADNMKVDLDGTITLFDFDNCGLGYTFLDVAYTLMLIFRSEKDKALFEKKKEAYLKGYTSILNLSEEEIRMLPYGGLAIWIFYSGIHCQRYDDFSNLFLNETFLKNWTGSVKAWMAYNNIDI